MFSSFLSTGEINLISALDYEASTQEFFHVQANFSDGVIATAVVEINVLDVNDNCPAFASSMSMVTITEPLRAGLWIAKPTVNDADTMPVNTHMYSVSGDNHFQIDQNGIITMKSLLESDRKQEFKVVNLTVSLSDYVGCGPVTHLVSVKIEKVLLQRYLFSERLYKFPIAEDQTTPFLIHCFKNIYGLNGTYALVNDATNSSCFSVSSKG